MMLYPRSFGLHPKVLVHTLKYPVPIQADLSDLCAADVLGI